MRWPRCAMPRVGVGLDQREPLANPQERLRTRETFWLPFSHSAQKTCAKQLGGRLHGHDIAERFELFDVPTRGAVTIAPLEIVGAQFAVGDPSRIT